MHITSSKSNIYHTLNMRRTNHRINRFTNFGKIGLTPKEQ